MMPIRTHTRLVLPGLLMGALVACGGGDEATSEGPEAAAEAPVAITPPPSLTAQLQALGCHVVGVDGSLDQLRAAALIYRFVSLSICQIV